MTTESHMESDLKTLVPRAMSEESRESLLAILSNDPDVDRVEHSLRQLRPQPLSKPARQGIVSKVIPPPRSRVRPIRWLSMAAVFTLIGMIIAIMMISPPDQESRENGVIAGVLPPAADGHSEAPPVVTVAVPEFTELELVNTYVLDKTDNGVIDLPGSSPVRQVSYQLMDELHWRSNREPNRRYIENRPREEMIYISTPAY
jgi:hypothetical protein